MSLQSAKIDCGPPCSLVQVERRLDDAAKLWGKASDSYFDPDEFRVHLQACIQAFRSVTWILQSHKAAIANFDVWYAGWQDIMRADPILRWLVEARNKIEKQGDLEAKSILRVTGSGSWFDGKEIEKELPPKTRPGEISLILKRFSRNQTVDDEAILKVERCWLDSEMPDAEVLDTLCHCYLVMRKLLRDAHEKLAVPAAGKCNFYDAATRTNEELPEFMMTAQQPRISWIRLKDGASVTMQQTRKIIKRTDPETIEAQQRYGASVKVNQALKDAKSFREICAAWFQHSKRMLEVDGHLIPTALIMTDKSMQIQQLWMSDRTDKHMVMRHVADSCKRMDAVSVMIINEAWTAPAEFAATGKHAIDCPQRGEAAVLHGLTRSGEAISCINHFTRQGGKVVFSEDDITEGELPNIMAPFAKVWNLYHKKMT